MGKIILISNGFKSGNRDVYTLLVEVQIGSIFWKAIGLSINILNVHALWSTTSHTRIYPKELIENCTKKTTTRKWKDVYCIAYNNKQLDDVLNVYQYNIGHLFNE